MSLRILDKWKECKPCMSGSVLVDTFTRKQRKFQRTKRKRQKHFWWIYFFFVREVNFSIQNNPLAQQSSSVHQKPAKTLTSPKCTVCWTNIKTTTIYTDSAYAVQAVHIDKFHWRKKGFVTSAGTPVKHWRQGKARLFV